MMTVLLVEDDVGIGRAVSQGLRAAGLPVDWQRGAAGVPARLAEGGVAVVVLDIGLPDGDGMALCRDLREAGHRVPVLMLTARGELDDRLEGFAAGADDYLPKPFAFAELLARVQVLARRAAQLRPGPIRHGPLLIDPDDARAEIDGAPLSLEPRALALLAALARARGALVPRAQLVEAVWGDTTDISDNAIDVTVSALRRRLAAVGPQIRIVAVRGKGLQLQLADD